jgi:hypothetical protein
MSRWTKLGIITDTCDREVTVFRHDAGDVRLTGQEDALEFGPAERDKLRELLDRAAMTGQEESAPASGCGHCGDRITLLRRCGCGQFEDAGTEPAGRHE